MIRRCPACGHAEHAPNRACPGVRRFPHLSGEELRRRAKRADKRLGMELDRLYVSDPSFRQALDEALDLEAEIEARKNR